MRINEHVHLIRKEFWVTSKVKRYINIYLVTGENCYLIDSGVAGSENVITRYMESLGRRLSDIKGIFLTHSHPDHAGAAAAIKRMTGCKIYAPYQEITWIENIQMQFEERPIPNFFQLLSESVQVDEPLCGGEIIQLEKGLIIRTVATPGHSHGSMSFVLNNNAVFTGDAIPAEDDLPIFTDFEESIKSLDILCGLDGIENYCPAWAHVYKKGEIRDVVKDSKMMLFRLKEAVIQVEKELAEISEEERNKEAMRRAGILQFYGNPLVNKSIEVCRKIR